MVLQPSPEVPISSPVFSLPKSARQLACNIFDQLRDASFDGVGISRETYGESETAAFKQIERHALDAGLETEWDAARNLIVRLPGLDTNLPTIATGSHLDSVPEGGNFDGAAGVIAGLVVLISVKERGIQQRTLELYVLRGEESAWFGGPCYIGSRAILGKLVSDDFKAQHRDSGETLETHMRSTGANIDRLKNNVPLIDPPQLACWFELHIEQGPVLTTVDKPVGIVTGIRGNHRYRKVTCTGEAAHSGAVPRWIRHDAVLAMADLMVRIDEHWRVLLEWGEDLVVTAGIVETNPNEHAISRVPGEVTFAFEYRSQDLKTLDSFSDLLQSECNQIEEARGVKFDLGSKVLAQPAKMEPKMISLLQTICETQGISHEIMASGAGHDSSVFANAGIPSGMIFVRNDKGSHNPYESMDLEDFFQATEVLGSAMLQVASTVSEDQ